MIYDSPAPLTCLSQPVTEVALSPPPPPKKKKITWLQILQWQTLAALLLGCMVFSSRYWWPQGYEAAKAQFVCQELGPIQKALCTLGGQVLDGRPLREAVTAFCTTVLEGMIP